MKKIVPLLLVLGIACLRLSAQEIIVQGKIANMPPSAVQVALLDYWAVDHWQQLSVLQLQTGGTFSAHVAPPAQAQGRIRVVSQPKVWSDFVFPAPGSHVDTVMTMALDYKTMNGGPAWVPGSAENDLYFALMSNYHALNLMRDSSSATPVEQVKAAEVKFNSLCADMIRQHPGTFTGDIVANLLYQPAKEDYPKDPKVKGMTANEFVAAHALDKIPFRTDRILYHNGFSKALNRYYNYFDPTAADGGKNYIEGIMTRRNGSEPVDLFLFKFLLDKMMGDKNEGGMNHLLTWYLPDCSDDSPLPDYTKTLVLALQYCTPGKVIDDLQVPGVDGNTVSLGEVCAKNKMTLLFFWKSNCSHCKEFKPELASLYEKYHPFGLEVLALSLDKLEAGWKETLQKEPTKWVNGYIPTERRQEINHHFPIPSTPTLIALDSQRKVLSRLILREQLDAYLKETLPKLGGG